VEGYLEEGGDREL